MGFLQNSIPTVTTSIMKCCLSQPSPLPACWILPCLWICWDTPVLGLGSSSVCSMSLGTPESQVQVSRRAGTVWQVSSGEVAAGLPHSSRAKGKEHP